MIFKESNGNFNRSIQIFFEYSNFFEKYFEKKTYLKINLKIYTSFLLYFLFCIVTSGDLRYVIAL